ncbi:MAG TPA: DoxX family protein [Aridibacter sp.]|nr:DoxX family protein [Aridibacter sp.]
MKAIKITYFVSTALVTLMMLLSAGGMLLANEMASQGFRDLGYPDYLTYPLGVAKILGLTAIWTGYSRSLKEWAFAGFFFNALIALSAHVYTNDGNWPGATAFILLLLISYFTWKKMSAEA